jgi:DNA helicase-2/ATP-dependent DNA helicase PcrA
MQKSSEKFATLNEIKHAASLLINEEDFEPQKINIIECDTTCDIKACPGSGKTTVLLAKLVILANHMPLDNNQGICVLTHTNVAIDEIKSKIGHKSDILFRYPNHFGTIQSFVDKYLANQALIKYYKTRINRVDSDIAAKRLLDNFHKLPKFEDKLHRMLWGKLYRVYSLLTKKTLKESLSIDESETERILALLISKEILSVTNKKYYLNRKNSTPTKLNLLLPDEIDLKKFLISFHQNIESMISREKDDIVLRLTLDFVDKKIYNGDETFGLFDSEHSKVFIGLKEKLFNQGILSYRDAYDLGKRYLNDYLLLPEAFSSRFKYVFIDEMQDTDSHQIKIIDKIFSSDKTIIQRFGDPHQAIYNKVMAGELWKLRDFNLSIDTSKRFGFNIANVLKTVCIEDNNSLKENELVKSLKPVIISFKDPLTVLPRFCELLLSLKIEGISIWNIAEDNEKKDKKKKKIKAIGWVGEPNKKDRSPDQLTIQSYFQDFRKNLKKKDKVNYTSLRSFLQRIEGATVKDYFNKIIEVLLHVLALEDVKYITEKSTRSYTKTTLLNYLKENNESFYSDLLMKIANWAKQIQPVESVNENVVSEVGDFINGGFKDIFKFDDFFENIKKFISAIDEDEGFTDQEITSNNIYKYEINKNLKVDVGTIHSAKGETHAATLYLETWYQGKHESEYIMDQLTGKAFIPPKTGGTHLKEALKMAYVGMSRPKYLLCMAIHEDRLNGHARDLENNGWIIEKAYGD